MFYGIVVYIYFMDNKQHRLPHLDAKHQDHEAIVSILEGDVLDVGLARSKMRTLLGLDRASQGAAPADWELAASGESPFKIDPLR
ncbi:MAG: DUF4160 domain-containing protein [Gammaproteobacteria bacterium]|nr:DUF4160 domain-containing protein [Gammaproteobacteria bacterium]